MEEKPMCKLASVVEVRRVDTEEDANCLLRSELGSAMCKRSPARVGVLCSRSNPYSANFIVIQRSSADAPGQ